MILVLREVSSVEGVVVSASILSYVLSHAALSIALFFMPVAMLCLSAKVIVERCTRRALKYLGVAHAVLLIDLVIMLLIVGNNTVTANVVVGYRFGGILFTGIVVGYGVAWVIRAIISALRTLIARLRKPQEVDYAVSDQSLI